MRKRFPFWVIAELGLLGRILCWASFFLNCGNCELVAFKTLQICDLDLGISKKKLGSCFIYGLFQPLPFPLSQIFILPNVPKNFKLPGSLEAEVQQDTMQLEQQKAKQAFDTRKIAHTVDASEIRRENQLIWQLSRLYIHYLLRVLYIPGG